jgi:hypothetical protein
MRTRSTHFTLALIAAATLAEAQPSSTIQNWRAPGTWEAAGIAIPTGPLQFVGITPCRLLDTRGNGFTGAWGPPLLSSGVPRNFPIAGQCGIPSTAQAVSANLGVTLTQGAGFLLIHPQGGVMPVVSSINYERAGQTIANAAVIPLGDNGGITVVAGVASTQFFMDVNGYYAPQAMVTSLNGISGDVTLVAGSNVSLTAGAGAITISSTATGVQGPVGPQGPTGAQGPQGLQGPTGATGAIGPQGPQGLQGVTGSVGAVGPAGAVGPQGQTGATGSQGPVGATWRNGWDAAAAYVPSDIVAFGGASYIALTSNTGSQPDGALGTDWDLVAARGVDGLAGATGAQGVAGATGATGADGPTGAQGATGAQGLTGATGATGAQGVAGATGATGADGPTGPQGPIGLTGATGATGSQGLAGTSAALVAGNHPNVSDGQFLMPWDITQSSTESSEDIPVAAGTASRLILRIGTALSGSQTATLTLRKNGADTAVTCTVPNNGTSCTDYVNSVSFADGDILSIKYNETGSPNSRVKYSFLYATQ